jgi:hypothetical protein
MKKHLRAAARIAFLLTFGLLAVLMGAAIILWVLYNEFIHRLPQYTGTHWWHPLGIGPVLIGTGIYWLRSLRSPSAAEHTRT